MTIFPARMEFDNTLKNTEKKVKNKKNNSSSLIITFQPFTFRLDKNRFLSLFEWVQTNKAHSTKLRTIQMFKQNI
jgi:hypothetical protein